MKLILAGILFVVYLCAVGCDSQPTSNEAAQTQKEINKAKDPNWQD